MADVPPEADPTADRGEDAGGETGRDAALGTPRWVYLFGITLVGLVALFVGLHLAGLGLGGHGP